MINDNSNGTEESIDTNLELTRPQLSKAASVTEEATTSVKIGDSVVIGHKKIWANKKLVEYFLFTPTNSSISEQEFPINNRPELFEAITVSNQEGTVSFQRIFSHKTPVERSNGLLSLMRSSSYYKQFDIDSGINVHDYQGDIFVKGTVLSNHKGILKVRTGANRKVTVYAHSLAEFFNVEESDKVLVFGTIKNNEVSAFYMACDKTPEQPRDTVELIDVTELPRDTVEPLGADKKEPQESPDARPPADKIDRDIIALLEEDISNPLIPIRFKDGQLVRFNPRKYRLSTKGLDLIEEVLQKDGKGKPMYASSGTILKETVYTPLLTQPIFISAIFENRDDKLSYAELTFTKMTGEVVITEPQMMETILTRSKLHRLHAFGIYFTDDNTKGISNFFKDLLNYNIERIKQVNMYSGMGWKGDFSSFVIGEREYFPDKVEEVVIRGLNDKLLKAYKPEGTINGWLDSVSGMIKHNQFRYYCYLATSAPLVKLFNIENMIINTHGKSGDGKSIGNRCGMSGWAHPYLSKQTADNTPNYFESIMGAFNNVPVNFDEIKAGSKDKFGRDKVQELVYKLGNGTGKGRLDKELNKKELGEWATTTLMSSENKINEDDSMGGSKVRAIDITAIKLVRDKEAVARFELDYVPGHQPHYGVFAPLVLQKIMKERPTLSTRYLDCITRLSLEVKALGINDNNTADRLVNKFAVVLLAGELFEELLQAIGGEVQNPDVVVKDVVLDAIQGIVNSPYHVRALEHLFSWLQQKERNFKVNGIWVLNDKESVPNDCYGDFISTTDLKIGVYGIREAFKNTGFTYESVRDEWLREGIILSSPADASKPLAIHTRMGNTPGTFILLNLVITQDRYGLSPAVSNFTKMFRATPKSDTTEGENISYSMF